MPLSHSGQGLPLGKGRDPGGQGNTENCIFGNAKKHLCILKLQSPITDTPPHQTTRASRPLESTHQGPPTTSRWPPTNQGTPEIRRGEAGRSAGGPKTETPVSFDSGSPTCTRSPGERVGGLESSLQALSRGVLMEPGGSLGQLESKGEVANCRPRACPHANSPLTPGLTHSHPAPPHSLKGPEMQLDTPLHPSFPCPCRHGAAIEEGAAHTHARSVRTREEEAQAKDLTHTRHRHECNIPKPSRIHS